METPRKLQGIHRIYSDLIETLRKLQENSKEFIEFIQI
jgi:hypothetical protein